MIYMSIWSNLKFSHKLISWDLLIIFFKICISDFSMELFDIILRDIKDFHFFIKPVLILFSF